MKAAITMAIALILSACTSTSQINTSKHEPGNPTTTTSMQSSTGSLNLTFDEAGNWVSISSVGSASTSGNSTSARENALMIATMRAKRTLAEFLSNDIRSSKTQTHIARDYSRTFLENKSTPESAPALNDEKEQIETSSGADPIRTENIQQSNRIATVLTEKITDSSAAILKGAFVKGHEFKDGQVFVELATTQQSINASKNLAKMMQGSVQ